MIEVILYSSTGDDDALVSAARALTLEKARLLVLSPTLDPMRLSAATTGVEEVRLLAEPRLVPWAFAIAARLWPVLDARADHLFMDASFAGIHALSMGDFVKCARQHQVFTVSGRYGFAEPKQWFLRQKFTFLFPTWECALVSADFWSQDPFPEFLSTLTPSSDVADQRTAERSFYETFGPTCDVACLLNGAGHSAGTENPFDGKKIEMHNLMASYVKAVGPA